MYVRPDMGMTHFFIRFSKVSKSFDSTELITHRGFTKIVSNQLTTQNGFLKFNSNRLTTKKNSQNFDSNQRMTQNIELIIVNIIIDYYIIYTQNRLLIQFDSWLKNYLKYWFESAHESMIRIKCWLGWPFSAFHPSVDFVRPFLGVRLKCLTEKLIEISWWFKQYLVGLNRFHSWLKRLSRNWLRINS